MRENLEIQTCDSKYNDTRFGCISRHILESYLEEYIRLSNDSETRLDSQLTEV